MAKIKDKPKYPPILALTGLITWYAKLTGLPSRDSVSEAKFIELLGISLNKEGIKSKSKNLYYKLVGNPLPSKLELTDSIDDSILDAIAKVIWKKLGYEQHGDRENRHWDWIKDTFYLPTSLDYIQEAGYYKYLSNIDKQIIQGMVSRYSAIQGLEPEFRFYKTNMWMRDSVVIGKMLINFRNGIVHYTRSEYHQGYSRSDLFKGYFSLKNGILNCMVFSEDSHNPLPTYFIFNHNGEAISDAKYIKGMCTYNLPGDNSPCSAQIILEKYDVKKGISSFSKTVESEVNLNLINKELVISKGEISSIEDLSSHRTFVTIKRICGFYLIAFFAPDWLSPFDNLIVGACEIRNDGSVNFIFPKGEKNYGNINADYSEKFDAISIKPAHYRFYGDALNYELNIDQYEKENGSNSYLNGIVSGRYLGKPFASNVSMLKMPEASRIEDVVTHVGVFKKKFSSKDKVVTVLYEQLLKGKATF